MSNQPETLVQYKDRMRKEIGFAGNPDVLRVLRNTANYLLNSPANPLHNSTDLLKTGLQKHTVEVILAKFDRVKDNRDQVLEEIYALFH